MALAVIDVGGTSIKFALEQDGQFSHRTSTQSPNNLDQFTNTLFSEIHDLARMAPLTGVAMSVPGAFNEDSGVIEGSSALPYIHNFNIQQYLASKFQMPVALENDANCAALAEIQSGAAVGFRRVSVLVLGTGVGGALIDNGHIQHGSHLQGGEFGYMLQGEETLSHQATAVAVARKYNSIHNTNLTGKEIFDLAEQSNTDAIREVNSMYHALAIAIYNIQYSFDPEVILIGGGISRNPALLPNINLQLDQILQTIKIATIRPKVMICKYKDEANLVGAVANYYQHQAN